MNYNKVMLGGRLTADPETVKFDGGSVTKLRLASNRVYTVDSEKKEETVFVDCDAFGKTGETIAKFLTKGREIFVEGRLRLDQWEKDGQKNSKLVVVVEQFQFVGGPKEEKEQEEAPPQKKQNVKKPPF